MRRHLLLALTLVPATACSSLDGVEEVHLLLTATQVLGAPPSAVSAADAQDSLSLAIELGCTSNGPLEVTVEGRPVEYFDGNPVGLLGCNPANASFDDDLTSLLDDGLLDIRIRSSAEELAFDVSSIVLDRNVDDVTPLSRGQTASFAYAVPGTDAANTPLSAELIYPGASRGTPVAVSATTDAVDIGIPDTAEAGPAVLLLHVFDGSSLDVDVDNDPGIAVDLWRSHKISIAVDVQ